MPLPPAARVTAADALWAALLRAPEPLSVGELHDACRVLPATIHSRLWAWRRAGIVQTVGDNPLTFTLDDQHRTPRAPRVRHDGSPTTLRLGRERMWRAIRILRSFDIPTLEFTAEVSRASAKTYVNALLRAGLLRTSIAPHSHGIGRGRDWATYSLRDDRGPQTPRVQITREDGVRRTILFDPNRGESIGIAGRAAPFFDPEG
ncbi:hypothetical protein [Sphingomonas sp. CCH15-F11]|uniref:hypothetical protein n=1 Tax=Sphingomonas sp. CCH15-F11 TaxID=1768785 RepID=UPI0012E36C89|nr:hypothetical protein [Sphingomonas sp. CCH15-F11]